MKTIRFIFLFTLVSVLNVQGQDLTVSDINCSGCLNETRNSEASQDTKSIVLKKEGSTLQMELHRYGSNCGTTGFQISSTVSEDMPCKLSVTLNPIIPEPMDCSCPMNVSFTLNGLEQNSFYLMCWWYEGQVELNEGEPLVLEYKTEDVVIDSLKFRLLKTTHQAMLEYQRTWDKKSQILQIPEEVEHEGEKYTVTSIHENFISSNNTIKEIIVPKTVKNTGFGNQEGFAESPFFGCYALEKIEVEEGNPVISSIDGVLFNKDKTLLIDYPIASPRELYTVPDGVTSIGAAAFFSNKYLKKVVLPDCVKTLNYRTFGGSNSLEEVILSSNIKELPVYFCHDCKKLKSVVIPEGVTTIGNGAFSGCKAMESFDFPGSLIYIDSFAFRYLSNLMDVYCHAEAVPGTTNNTFGDVDLSKATLHVPAASIEVYRKAAPWNGFKNIVAIEETTGINPSTAETTASQISDLQGRRVQGEPKHGVYVQNGKKVMK